MKFTDKDYEKLGDDMLTNRRSWSSVDLGRAAIEYSAPLLLREPASEETGLACRQVLNQEHGRQILVDFIGNRLRSINSKPDLALKDAMTIAMQDHLQINNGRKDIRETIEAIVSAVREADARKSE